ncbi:MAG: hypothetical protein LH470_02270 [Lysobacter sp.]|nr:hypothetical protein [Lysobacter sp.]
MRNLYRQYLWGFAPAHFDFIDITERYDADFVEFTRKYLGGESAASVVLANPDRDSERYVIDPVLRSRSASTTRRMSRCTTGRWHAASIVDVGRRSRRHQKQ